MALAPRCVFSSKRFDHIWGSVYPPSQSRYGNIPKPQDPSWLPFITIPTSLQPRLWQLLTSSPSLTSYYFKMLHKCNRTVCSLLGLVFVTWHYSLESHSGCVYINSLFLFCSVTFQGYPKKEADSELPDTRVTLKEKQASNCSGTRSRVSFAMRVTYT